MGHKINPNIYRLGISRTWKYFIRKDFLLNINLTRFLKSLFLNYSARFTSPQQPRKNDLKSVSKNIFKQKSLVFSHVNVGYMAKNNQYFLNIYLLDNEFETVNYSTHEKLAKMKHARSRQDTGKYLLAGILRQKRYQYRRSPKLIHKYVTGKYYRKGKVFKWGNFDRYFRRHLKYRLQKKEKVSKRNFFKRKKGKIIFKKRKGNPFQFLKIKIHRKLLKKKRKRYKFINSHKFIRKRFSLLYHRLYPVKYKTPHLKSFETFIGRTIMADYQPFFVPLYKDYELQPTLKALNILHKHPNKKKPVGKLEVILQEIDALKHKLRCLKYTRLTEQLEQDRLNITKKKRRVAYVHIKYFIKNLHKDTAGYFRHLRKYKYAYLNRPSYIVMKTLRNGRRFRNQFRRAARKTYQYYPLWFLKTTAKGDTRKFYHLSHNYVKNLKILKFFLRYLPHINNLTLKKRLFFMNILSVLLFSFIRLLEIKRIQKNDYTNIHASIRKRHRRKYKHYYGLRAILYKYIFKHVRRQRYNYSKARKIATKKKIRKLVANLKRKTIIVMFDQHKFRKFKNKPPYINEFLTSDTKYNNAVTKTTTLRTKRYMMHDRYMSRKLFLFWNFCVIYLSCCKYRIFKRLIGLVRNRFHLYKAATKCIYFNIQTITHQSRKNTAGLVVKYCGLHHKNISAEFLANYISLKLGSYYTINQVLKPLMRFLKQKTSVTGFRFIISGRLTRKERAAFIIKAYRKMPLTQYDAKIDYAFTHRALRFGTVGIKIYLLRKFHVPFYYFFEFRLNKTTNYLNSNKELNKNTHQQKYANKKIYPTKTKYKHQR